MKIRYKLLQLIAISYYIHGSNENKGIDDKLSTNSIEFCFQLNDSKEDNTQNNRQGKNFDEDKEYIQIQNYKKQIKCLQQQIENDNKTTNKK